MSEQPQPREHHDPAQPRPVKVDMTQIIGAGMVVWAIALVVVLVTPGLHTGGRAWWPWVPVISLGLGVIAIGYVRRGRGNARAA